MRGYFEYLREKTLACLLELRAADLDEGKTDFAGAERIKIGLALGRYFGDHLSHMGQIYYLRSHIAGWGRYPK